MKVGSRGIPGPGRGWPLRTYFVLLVMLFVAVAAGATAYVWVQSNRDGRNDAERDTRHSARTAAKQVGSAVTELRGAVEQLAATPGIEQTFNTPAACSLTAEAPAGFGGGHVDVLRADGSVACSSRPPAKGGEPPPGYGDAPWLRRARSGEVFTAPVVDPATGRHVVLSARPIKGGVVAGFLELDSAGRGLVDLFGGGRQIVFAVTSRDGKVLIRSIDPRRWIGKSVNGTAFEEAGDAVDRRDLDGTERLYSDATVPGLGWTFSAGVEKAAALADGHRLRDRQLVIILAGLALVLAGAFAVYRRVAIPVTRLGSAVRSSSEASPHAPVEVAGPAEVGDLGEDINALIFAVNHELAERERAEQSARASERNYRLLFASNPIPMWIYDIVTRNILETNDAAVAQYGYSREELLNLTMAAIESPVPAAEARPGEPATTRYRRKDGTEVEVRTIGHAVTFAGRPARFVLAEDVGERMRMAGQLRQAQRMEAIGRLAGGVAHDFNNLLTAILGNTDLLLGQLPADDPRRAQAEEVMGAGERAVALTRQLLTFGRGRAAEPVALDLNDAVRGLEPMLRRLIRSNIEIVTTLGQDVGRIHADRGQIEQVVVNLAVNAGDAMPTGGRLTITTSVDHLDADYFRQHPAGTGEPGRYSMLEVADTGVGMDQETLSHIFEPFFTTKPEEQGTGLGLATVYGIVQQSRGFVWVYSEPHRGTTFKVYLPVVEADAAAEPEGGRELPAPAPGGTVLLVEDDEGVRAVVRSMLEAGGFEILEAAEGEEALALSQARAPGSLDLLVTDTIVPGPGGVQLADRVRGRHPELRTVVMSGYRDSFPGAASLGPHTEFIAKPFGARDLYAKLAALLPGSA